MKARINAAEIAYDDHGIGQPLLFLHAFPLNRSMWAGQMRALLQVGRYRLVALDWRGCGESVLPGDVLTLDMLADDVAGLMDALGMSRAILCGLSMGGYVAFAFLRKYPERVAGLILADTRPDADTEEGKANRENVARLALQQGPEAVADLQLPKLITQETRLHHPEVEARVRQMIATATGEGIAALSRALGQRSAATDLLAAIRCPTQIIVGGQDVLAPPTIAQEYAAQIPGAQCAIIPQAGHLANLEQPEIFLRVMHDFLLTNFSDVL